MTKTNELHPAEFDILKEKVRETFLGIPPVELNAILDDYKDKAIDYQGVDIFSDNMKLKLDNKRKQGYNGWNSSLCTNEQLSKQLLEHVYKGDPVDVANLAMMIHQRGESINVERKKECQCD